MIDISQALRSEADFTRSILISGFEHLRKANVSNLGAYFNAFTCLSTGLERIGKLCILLDHYGQHAGTFPSNDALKNKIGHNLKDLYKFSRKIVTHRKLSFKYYDNLDGPEHQAILKVLSDFGMGDRYANLNFLTKDKRQSDPIGEWYRTVDKLLFELHIKDERKAQIINQATMIGATISDIFLTIVYDEEGKQLSTTQAIVATQITRAIMPYRQMYVGQMLRYWREFLRYMQDSSYELGNGDIPFLHEYFDVFLGDDNYFKTRKTLS